MRKPSSLGADEKEEALGYLRQYLARAEKYKWDGQANDQCVEMTCSEDGRRFQVDLARLLETGRADEASVGKRSKTLANHIAGKYKTARKQQQPTEQPQPWSNWHCTR